jgi:cytoskeletal protein CcmA (bactofilin family)
MASSYTGLGTELMTTGENAGTWGTTTNTNLQIIEQMVGGYIEKSIAGSAQTTTLTVSDGSTGAELSHRIIKFTGTITGNQIVTIPLDVQQLYVLVNGTSGAYTVQFKYATGSGSSFTFAATDKGTKLVYATADDGTNPNLVDSGLGSVGAYDLDGNELTLDADSDTSITASTDDQIDFEIAGADDFTMTANAFNVLTGSHVTFADSANAKFGTGNDMLLYHDGSNSYITNAQGALKIATETSGIAVTIGHTTSETTIADNLTVTGDADIDGTTNLDAVDIDGAVQLDSTLTVGADDQGYDIKFFGDTASAYMLWDTSTDDLVLAGAAGIDLAGDIDVDGTANLDAVDIDGAVQIDNTVTVGVNDTGYDVKFFGATSGAYMLWDESTDDLVLAGAAGIDLAGDIDVDGTANLDAVDIDGAVQLDATLTVGADDQGYDVILYGDTASANVTWDTSADDLIFNGGAGLIVPDGQLTLGSTAVSSTAAEINLLDTASANSVVNSKAVIYGSSGELAGTLSTVAQTNVTSLGTLTALTVDDVAIDGKVVTMTGSSSDTAVFTAGTNGTLSIVTTDDAAAAANMTLTADGTFEADGTTVTLDSAGDVVLDAGGADVFLKDDGTLFGTFTNSSGELVIKSSSSGTTALTFSGANATFAGTLATAAGGFNIAGLDIDGATDIGEAIVDADLFIIDNGAGGTNRKVAASRIVTYIDANSSAATVGKAIAMAIVFG